MKFNQYRVYLDISGNIGIEDFFVGVIVFNERFRKKFLNEFQARFPNLKSFKKKGTNLSGSKLKEVISFMDEKRIHMTCLHFTKQKLIDTETLIINKLKTLTNRNPVISFFREKVLAVLYYYALKRKTYPKYIYEGNICMETQIKIDKVMSKLSSISQRDSYHFYLSPNWRRLQHLLKFADFVASAGRRLDMEYLNKIAYFELISPDISEYDLDHVFGINKLKADIFKRQKKKHL